jgi:hypothetical protein
MIKMKWIVVVGVLFILGSCAKDYDERFSEIEQRIQNVLEQVQGAAELNNAIKAAEAQIISLQNAIEGLPDAGNLSSGLNAIGQKIEELEAQLASLGETQLTGDELVLLVDGLSSDLDLLKENLNSLMESNNVLTGDLVIFDQSSLNFALALGDKVRIVTGRVKVLGENLEAEALNVVTSKITAVTGDVDVMTDKSLDFSNLESVGGNFGLVGHEVDIQNLQVVGGDFQVAFDGDYDFPELKFVGNRLVLGVVIGAENVDVFSKTSTSGKTAPRIINFLGVRANEVIVYEDATMDLESGVADMSFTGLFLPYVYLPNATSVIFGNVPLTDVWAPLATNIELHYNGLLKEVSNGGRVRSLYVVAPAAENVTVKANSAEHNIIIITGPLAAEDNLWNSYSGTYLSMDMAFQAWNGFLEENQESEETFSQPESLRTWNAEINLPELAKTEQSLFLASSFLNMPLLKEINEERDVFLLQNNIILPELTIQGSFYAYAPESMEVASLNLDDFELYTDSRLKAITLNNQNNSFTADTVASDLFEALELLEIYGANGLDVPIEIEIRPEGEAQKYPNLETIRAGGTIQRLRVGPFNNAYQNKGRRLPKLNRIYTSGMINSIMIRNLDELINVTLDHDHIPGLGGGKLQVWNNKKLESLTTGSLNFVNRLKVYDNIKLEEVDFSSIKNVVLSGDVEINIANNALRGSLKNYIPPTGTTEASLGELTSSSLYSLKGLVQNLKDRGQQEVSGNTMDLIVNTGISPFRLQLDIVDDLSTSEQVETDSFELYDLDVFTWSDSNNVVTFDEVLTPL